MSSHTRCCCRGNYALGKSAVHSLHNDQPERGRRPTEVSWVVFIRLLHTLKHACLQTINSKEDNGTVSSTRSGIGARMRDAGEGRPVDSLTPCPNRAAPVVSLEPCKLRSDPTLVKSPLKVAYRDSLHALAPSGGCTARELKSMLERSQGYHLWLSSCCRQEGNERFRALARAHWARAQAKIGTANVHESSNEASCAEERKSRGYHHCVRGACKRKSGVAIHACRSGSTTACGHAAATHIR